MSDLDDFRNHAREMATSAHRIDCRDNRKRAAENLADGESNYVTIRTCADRTAHDPHRCSRYTYCPGVCTGCNDQTDRERWLMLADEIDAYMAPSDEGEGLF